MVLEDGEKYLSIRMNRAKALDLFLSANNEGKKDIEFAAFSNKNKDKDGAPDFKSDGVAVWENTKRSQNVPKSVKEENVAESYADGLGKRVDKVLGLN